MAGRQSLSVSLYNIILIFWCSKQTSEQPGSNLKFQGWWWWSVTQAGNQEARPISGRTAVDIRGQRRPPLCFPAHEMLPANVHASVTSSPVFSLVHASNSGSQKVERAR